MIPLYIFISFQNGEFDWDSRTQGLILGCFFWGYIVVQVPSGLIAERYSGKNVFGWSIFLTGIFNILTPIAARTNFTALIVVRVLTGAVEVIHFNDLVSTEILWKLLLRYSRVVRLFQIIMFISFDFPGIMTYFAWDLFSNRGGYFHHWVAWFHDGCQNKNAQGLPPLSIQVRT